MAVSGQVASRRLMEVSINGELIRAADGHGWRAMAFDSSGGIVEHARLSPIDGLQGLATGAFLLSVASLLLGQKCLLDIRVALDQINQRIGRIEQFLEQQRLAEVRADVRYLEAAFAEISAGEFDEITRGQLESISRRLDANSSHLFQQLEARIVDVPGRARAKASVAFKSVNEKLERLEALTEELGFCLDAKLACWYLSASYSVGRTKLDCRRAQIHEDLRTLAALRDRVGLEADIDSVTGWWDSLKARFSSDGVRMLRSDLKGRAHGIKRKISQSSQDGIRRLRLADQAIEESRRPARLCLEVKDGSVLAAYSLPKGMTLT